MHILYMYILAYIIKNHRFCRFDNKIEALITGCYICYNGMINEKRH